MSKRTLALMALAGLALLALAGCLGSPDWAALYSDKLGQPVAEINTKALNTDFMDENGNLTRIAVARLADGSTVLLGLPAFSNSTETVVQRTVPLFQDEWQSACRSAVAQQPGVEQGADWGISWGGVEGAVGNTFQAYPDFNLAGGSQRNLYCEFAFLPEGWELRVVHVQGIIKREQP